MRGEWHPHPLAMLEDISGMRGVEHGFEEVARRLRRLYLLFLSKRFFPLN